VNLIGSCPFFRFRSPAEALPALRRGRDPYRKS
jgi:hypothetical protein